MTMNIYTNGPICNVCNKREDHMISISMASGDLHFCEECWAVPSRREYYEDESAWKRVGNRFVRIWDWEDYPFLRT